MFQKNKLTYGNMILWGFRDYKYYFEKAFKRAGKQYIHNDICVAFD